MRRGEGGGERGWVEKRMGERGGWESLYQRMRVWSAPQQHHAYKSLNRYIKIHPGGNGEAEVYRLNHLLCMGMEDVLGITVGHAHDLDVCHIVIKL